VNPLTIVVPKMLIWICKSTTFWCKIGIDEKNSHAKKSSADARVGWWSLLLRYCSCCWWTFHILYFALLNVVCRSRKESLVHLIMQISWRKYFCFTFESSTTSSSSCDIIGKRIIDDVDLRHSDGAWKRKEKCSNECQPSRWDQMWLEIWFTNTTTWSSPSIMRGNEKRSFWFARIHRWLKRIQKGFQIVKSFCRW
jgi:hypothetical protein